MSAETNKQIILRIAEEVLNQANMVTLEELLAVDLLKHNPPPGLPGTREGSNYSSWANGQPSQICR
jgi:hypothetical protein